MHVEHDHDRPEPGTILWFFHHTDHDGISHCEGGLNNPYHTEHVGKKHVIDKEYARGHGINREPTWFHFTEKMESGKWNMESGEEIPVADVPESFKHRDVEAMAWHVAARWLSPHGTTRPSPG